MARSMTTCTGQEIKIGDKVRTKDGTVIKVEGGAIGARFYNAEECEVVDKDTETTKEKHQKALADANASAGPDDQVKGVGGGQDDTDCVIWGN